MKKLSNISGWTLKYDQKIDCISRFESSLIYDKNYRNYGNLVKTKNIEIIWKKKKKKHSHLHKQRKGQTRISLAWMRRSDRCKRGKYMLLSSLQHTSNVGKTFHGFSCIVALPENIPAVIRNITSEGFDIFKRTLRCSKFLALGLSHTWFNIFLLSAHFYCTRSSVVNKCKWPMERPSSRSLE